MRDFLNRIKDFKFYLWAGGALVLCAVLALLKVDFLMTAITLVFYCLISLSLYKKQTNIFFFFFIVSFFIFLVSGDLAEQVFHEYYWLRFSEQANTHAHICILLGAIALGVGYLIFPFAKETRLKPLYKTDKDIRNSYKELSPEMLETSSFIKYIRFAALIVFFAAYFILSINSVHKILWVREYGYVESYLSYSSPLPSVIAEFGDFAFIALLVFFSTMPKRNLCIVPVGLWFVYAAASLMMGGRSIFIYNSVFLIAYMIYRNKHFSGNQTWIPKNAILVLIILTPFLLIFLRLFEYIRVGNDIQMESLWNTFIRFFVDLGSSSKVIKYGYEGREIIASEFKCFTFGELINYFKYSSLFNWFGEAPALHSVEYATEGHSFAHYLSYLVMPENFLQGHGVGSSFLAILYADFGYFGIIYGSLIYGCLYKMWTRFEGFNWVEKTILLYMSYELLLSPRGSYDSFLAVVLNVKFILAICGIWIFAKLLQAIENYKKSKN